MPDIQHIKCNKCSAVAAMADRLATIDMDRKLGLCPFEEGELSPHLTQCGQGRCVPPYEVESQPIQPFGHNRHGPKTGEALPLWGRGAASPSNTTWSGSRPTALPSTCSAELYSRTSRIKLVSMVLLEWYRPPIGPV